MKKLLLISALVALMSLPAVAGDRPIQVMQLWNSENMLVNTTNVFSPPLDLNQYQPADTVFSLQTSVTNILGGTNVVGIVTFSYDVSNDGINFVRSSNIVASLSMTNSQDAAGHSIYEITPVRAKWLRFTAVTGTTNAYVGATLQIR